jgi:acetaldehyde dehydrogenase/alcohol dehydrogenase
MHVQQACVHSNPPFFASPCLQQYLLACSKRAFIVTDPPLFELGMVNSVLERLRPLGIATKVFTDVEPDPTLGMVTKVRL